MQNLKKNPMLEPRTLVLGDGGEAESFAIISDYAHV